MKPGYFELEGIDPRTGADTIFRISQTRLKDIGKYHPDSKLKDLHSVKWLCENPVAGFEGIRHLDNSFCDPKDFVELPDPGGICVSGIPNERYLRRDVVVPVQRNVTFCFVGTTRLVIWNWFWFTGDRLNPQFPDGWKERFDRQVWPKQEKSTS